MTADVAALHLSLARAAAANMGLYVPLLYVELAQQQQANGKPLTDADLRWVLTQVYGTDVLAGAE